MQEELMPGRETQDWMWEEIEKKAAAGEKKQDRWAGLKITASIAAAVLLFVLLIPQTSWADQITGFIKEFFYTGADVKENIAQNVYEDEGKYGHVRMQIRELLSDGACAYFNICYEALDEEGEEWLADQIFDVDDIRFTTYDDTDGSAYGSWQLNELEELATKKERHFAFSFENSSGSYSFKNKSMTLFYPMYHSQGIGKVNIVSNLDTVSYRLVGDKSPSKYYEPKYLVVSRLSYALFWKNQGANCDWIDKDGTWHFRFGKGFLEEKGDKELGDYWVYADGIPLSFTMEDGSKLDMGYAQADLSHAEGLALGSDLLLSAGHFNVDSEEFDKIMTIDDPGALTEMVIDGVHYDLVKEEVLDEK